MDVSAWQQQMIADLCQENDSLKREIAIALAREHRAKLELHSQPNQAREEWAWWMKWLQT